VRKPRLTASRELLALATPIALTQLAQVALTTIDIVMIGVLGVEALAAGGLAIVLFNQVRTMGVGLITAAGNRVASLAAQEEPGALAQDAERGVRDVVRASLVLATAAGLVGALLSTWSPAGAGAPAGPACRCRRQARSRCPAGRSGARAARTPRACAWPDPGAVQQRRRPPGAVLVLRGLPAADIPLAPTPPSWSQAPREATAPWDATLLLLDSAMGHAFRLGRAAGRAPRPRHRALQGHERGRPPVTHVTSPSGEDRACGSREHAQLTDRAPSWIAASLVHEMHAQTTERGHPRLRPSVAHAIRRARPRAARNSTTRAGETEPAGDHRHRSRARGPPGSRHQPAKPGPRAAAGSPSRCRPGR
jgi:hypothetical protein